MILTLIKTVKLGILSTFFLAVYYLYVLYSPISKIELPILLIASSYTLTMIIIFVINNITDKVEDKINKRKTNFNYTILIISIIFLIGTLAFLPIIFWIANILTLILGTLYSLRFKKIRIKEITLIKNIYITIIGSSIIVLPLAFFISNPQPLLYITWPILFIVILITDIIWDIKDYKGDKKKNIQTLPVRLGIKKTKLILSLICILLSILEIVLLQRSTFFLPLIVLTTIFINEKRSYWYYEGMYYIISVLLIISIIQI